ncbi:MAG: protease HtpX [Chloroflexi bacterium]|nr:MAG: protease HtpX [Chloroflexota bacterium]TMF26634.1 MAG: protease HtpX [Chloroflexota bacterium]TMF96099.1 MAG: protease HtpX [Chloroflexota bacterium]
MNQLKTAFLLVALTVLLVLVGRILFGDAGTIAFLAIAIVMNGVAYWFSDRIALASAQAQEVSPADAPMLYRLADRLAVQYGVPRPRVYVSPDPSPNAFATGRNPSHAAICVNEGLLRILDEEELYGVLAHEFGHVRNRDILISSVVAVLAGTITLISQFGWYLGGGRDDRQSPFGPILALLTVILAPIAALLIQLAVSRSREYQADKTGAEVSGDPMALASALRKLERATEVVPSQTAQPAFAHLYIVNPLHGGWAGLFSTHPPIEERIRRLEEMAGGIRR